MNSGDLDVIDASAETGYYRWTGTQPSTGSPGFTYGAVLAVYDGAQMIQMAFGGSGSGKLKIRRNDSGTYYAWTTFWSDADFDIADYAVTDAPTFTNTINTYRIDNSSYIQTNQYYVDANNGLGIQFWGGGHSYSHYMSQSGDGTFGGQVEGETTSDYNQYFNMASGTNRGFVFMNTDSPIFSINPDGIHSNVDILMSAKGADGNLMLHIDADSDNAIESANAVLQLSQDGGGVVATFETQEGSNKIALTSGTSFAGRNNVMEWLYNSVNVTFKGTVSGDSYGTATVPTFVGHESDSDTGAYTESSNVYAITTGGVRRFRIYNTIADFDVPINSSGDITGASFNGMSVKGTGVPSGSQILRSNDNAYTYLGWINTTSGANSADPSRIYTNNGGSDAFLRYMTPANFIDFLQGEHWSFENGDLNLNTDTHLSGGTGGRFRVDTSTGYVEIGPQNSSWCHIYSGHKFYFNQDIRILNKMVMTHISTAYASADVTFSTSAATGGLSGDIWYQYT